MTRYFTARKSLSFLLKLGISLGLSFYVLYLVDIRHLGTILSNINWLYLVPIVVLFLCFVVLGGMRIAFILRSEVKERLTYYVVVKWYFLANAMGAFSPAQTGELSLAFFLKDYDVKMSQGMTAVLLDKILMLFLFLAASLVTLFYYFPQANLSALLILGGAGIGIMTCGSSRLMRKFVRERIVLRYFPGLLPACQMVMSFMLHRPGALALNLFFGIIRLAVSGLMIHLSLMAFGYQQAAFNDVFWLNCLVRTTTFIPISINGIGLLEGAAIKVFSIEGVGIPQESVLSAFLLNRVMLYIFAGGLVVWHLFRKKKVTHSADLGVDKAAFPLL